MQLGTTLWNISEPLRIKKVEVQKPQRSDKYVIAVPPFRKGRGSASLHTVVA